MNIFVLDTNALVAAEQMCDKHIPKMIVETTQMLCTTHRICDCIGEYYDFGKSGRKIKRWKHKTDSDPRTPTLYKAAMVNHPCNVWLRESIENYRWLSLHGIQLLSEFKTRFGNFHGSSKVLGWCAVNDPENISDAKQTPFAQAMPDKYKDPNDAVNAYRTYYVSDKSKFAKWEKKNNEPYWWTERLKDKLLVTG
jgi:hypothetical protein